MLRLPINTLDPRPRIGGIGVAILMLCTCRFVQANGSQNLTDYITKSDGTSLPDAHELGLALVLGGLYVPVRVGPNDQSVALLEGSDVVALFGHHSAWGLWWENVAVLNISTRFGARVQPIKPVTLEIAYLHHWSEQQWVDDLSVAAGGIRDFGLEVKGWWSVPISENIKLEPHLWLRYFWVYHDEHCVPGAGIRMKIEPARQQAIHVDLRGSVTSRRFPRASVPKLTWGAQGDVSWYWFFLPPYGMFADVFMASNMLVGDVPMLELQRSTIHQPYGIFKLGFLFSY
jgi:hypothetical protein